MEKLVVNKARNAKKVNVKDLIFCILLLIWPTLQFLVFYVGVNFNSFLLMFQTIDLNETTNAIHLSWSSFVNNFNECKVIITQYFPSMIKNTFIYWAVGVGIGSPLGLLFSYYIFKKLYGSSFFRVILYLPQIISGLILVLLYKIFIDFPFSKDIMHVSSIFGSTNSKLIMFMIIIFNIWSSFGTSVLMYANAMSSISQEVLEAAQLDGAKGIREFIHIVFPMIFSTWSVFFVTSIATFFTNQANLYSFFGLNCDSEIQTIGYYMFSRLKQQGAVTWYPKLALLGIILSLIAIPITLLIRKLLEKYGPSSK